MAQLLKPAQAPGPTPRISQLLPTVKCSSCSQPVPFSELTEHICPPQPPLPLQQNLKPPASPRSPSSLLPSRLQSLVSSRASAGSPQRDKGATTQQQQQLDRKLSVPDQAPIRRPSQHDPFQRIPPSINNSNNSPPSSILSAPRRTSPAPMSSMSSPSRAPPAQPASILISRGNPNPQRQDSSSSVRFPAISGPERVATPVRSVVPPVTEASRTRTPSNAGSGRNALPNPFDEGSPQPVMGRPRATSLRRDPSLQPPQNQAPNQPLPPTPSLSRTRTPSNATSSTGSRPSFDVRRPSFDTRGPSLDTRGPSLDTRRPSLDTRGPSLESRRPSLDTRPRPSFDTQTSRPPFDAPRTPSSPAPVPRPPRQSSVPFPSAGAGPSTANPPIFLPQTPSKPSGPLNHPPSSTTPIRREDIDTKTGGEAGMAGVGRRGFAAAARAAMFATSFTPNGNGVHAGPGLNVNGNGEGAQGMDGRRANAPRYLDINAAMGHVARAAMTPPLSPHSGHSRSPVSPYPASPISPAGSTTPTNGQHPDLNSNLPLSNPYESLSNTRDFPTSPRNQKQFDKSINGSEFVRIASPSRTPSPVSNPFNRRFSGDSEALSVTPGLGSIRLPFVDKYNMDQDGRHGDEDESDEESVYTHNTDLHHHRRTQGDATPKSPSSDSDLGLAYADESEDETPVVLPLDIRKSSISSKNNVKFPMLTDKHERTSPPSVSSDYKFSRKGSQASSSARSESVSSSSGAGPSRTRSASAATQSTTKSAGALERAMETLIEEGASVSVLASGSVLASMSNINAGSSSRPTSGKPNRSNTVPGPVSPEYKPPKLPTRSHTSPSHPHVHERTVAASDSARVRGVGRAGTANCSSGGAGKGKGKERVVKERVCARCENKIEDGRWIQMDGGSVLCERCWKNMYLPKCRRCNLPIEKQAVSSSDGQLKGKYHRDCFNCHACHKPFPDKEFYVFDGKPLCAYHYHEANDSLCAAPTCGQPIEGPCAVTHAGKRFHPEHLLCEFEEGCKEPLAEYWEVDGQMLCERHAGVNGSRFGDGESVVAEEGESGVARRRERGGALAGETAEGRAMKRMTRFIDLGAGEDDGASEVNIL
ncbi:hypothetical protein BJ138DRAFT_304714 [Hygrophoropsis aurantiaca]|uniref:Uncharacterized protein n=1 Tax=Hygrophoropsis aurantiaca TaxID=72124 RepID=A0ACB8A864_9AGAM|nr:hypothetical protein BJ138DRAFT_304714 [Hygrophoropsis aurantiaca]